MTLECQKWKQMLAWSTTSFSRPMVTTGTTIALMLWKNFLLYKKNFPSYKKNMTKIFLNFRKRVLPNLLSGFIYDRFAVLKTFSQQVFSILLVSQTSFTTFSRLVPRVRLLSPCQIFWKINKSPAIILTASTDKFNKQQDVKPRFLNGIAFFCLGIFVCLFLAFDKFYRVALLRHSQVL